MPSFLQCFSYISIIQYLSSGSRKRNFSAAWGSTHQPAGSWSHGETRRNLQSMERLEGLYVGKCELNHLNHLSQIGDFKPSFITLAYHVSCSVNISPVPSGFSCRFKAENPFSASACFVEPRLIVEDLDPVLVTWKCQNVKIMIACQCLPVPARPSICFHATSAS